MEEGEKKMHIMRMSLVGIIGAPLPPNTTAEIEYVPIDRLFVDHRYQANLSPARVRRIQEAYNPIAAGLLLVGARDNGMFAVIDGPAPARGHEEPWRDSCIVCGCVRAVIASRGVSF